MVEKKNNDNSNLRNYALKNGTLKYMHEIRKICFFDKKTTK